MPKQNVGVTVSTQFSTESVQKRPMSRRCWHDAMIPQQWQVQEMS